MPVDLVQLLAKSELQAFLEVDPHGLQLPSFAATAHGVKPAMDLWVRRDRWEAFTRLAERFGLAYRVDGCFDRASPALDRLPPGSTTTTRAAFARTFAADVEAHVFLAGNEAALHAAASAGWYPLVVGGRLVEKHRADHARFGAALGYPSCCRGFFHRRNHWDHDNSYYAAWRATAASPRALANGFLRHTPWSYIAHLPCSLACAETQRYAMAVRALLLACAPAYTAEIDRRIRTPVLCLSELRIYRFEGVLLGGSRVDYDSVEPVNPTSARDPLYALLARADRVEVEGCVVRAARGRAEVGTYRARADRHGPEFPFLVRCGDPC